MKHIVELYSCFQFHLSKELYCNCTLHGICIIHSCTHSEDAVVLFPYIARVLHTKRTLSLKLRSSHSPVDP